MNADPRNAILSRLRDATASMDAPAAPPEPRRPGNGVADFATFAKALAPLGPTFDLARDPEEARAALAGVMALHGVGSAVRWDHPDLDAVDAVAVMEKAGVSVIAPEALPHRVCPTLAAVDMGITGVAHALCATGTLVLHAGAGRERGAALVPRLHVALVARSRLLPDLPALFDRLAGTPMPSAVTCVSGISSTGDIEFVYVRGVHGPLCAHVIGLDWL